MSPALVLLRYPRTLNLKNQLKKNWKKWSKTSLVSVFMELVKRCAEWLIVSTTMQRSKLAKIAIQQKVWLEENYKHPRYGQVLASYEGNMDKLNLAYEAMDSLLSHDDKLYIDAYFVDNSDENRDTQ